jgi:lipoic acid synthetase
MSGANMKDSSDPHAVQSAGYDALSTPGRKPPWIRVRLPSGESYQRLKGLMRSKSLHTVCEEALCPNIAECWGCGTATFMILGDVCTRNCRFCAVKTGVPKTPHDAAADPSNVAEAAAAMGLRHVVVTSVTRDDLPDGGASVFAETIRRIHQSVPGCTVEVLIPDFGGERLPLEIVVDAGPEILAHNVETVSELYHAVRPQAIYQRSLHLLGTIKEIDPLITTKSGIMVGLGETREELIRVLFDLRLMDCDILTIGQYLRPSPAHLPVNRYYPPEEFEELKQLALSKGFRWVESGPLVRSSYHAAMQIRALKHGGVEST